MKIVHANPAKENVLWSVVKLIHVINRNAKRLETGGYTGRENKEVIEQCQKSKLKMNF